MPWSSSILHRVETAARVRLGLPNRWVERTLLGRQLALREGTISTPYQPDYDDAWLIACARNSRVAFDVGANVGLMTILMLLCGVEQVVLVDANARALSVAAENLIRNQLSASCSFVCAFAGDTKDANVDFWTVGTGAAGSMYPGHAKTAARAGSVSTVPTITLDQLCERYRIVPDLVKVDVEGAEHQVLCGARTFAMQARTRFLIEMHSPPELPMVRNAELVLAWAREVGYAAWYLSEARRIESPDPIKHRGRCHLLLQPATWPYPAWLAGIAQSATPQGM